jgi:XTP/dITP diphosphohydrolase
VKKILIATGNPGKFNEIIFGLKPQINKGLKVFSLKDLKIKEKVEETGKTFQENSLLKAKFYSELSNLPTIGDDGGLIIPYLNNGPGVLSRRWPGYEANDNELIDFCLFHLRGVIGANRTAYLVVNLCFFEPETKKIFYQEEKIKGRIAQKTSSKRVKGYPYRALFIVEKYNKYYDELTIKEHQQINHRLKAVTKLTKKIKDLL